LSLLTRRFTFALAVCLASAAYAAPLANAAPDPAYTVDPAAPRCGDPATYTDASTVDALLAVAKVEWDFDNNGDYEVVDDMAPFQTTHTYNTLGTKTFGMRVTDNNPLPPGVTEEDQTVPVATAPPQATFTVSDSTPVVNGEVLFASDASDPDGDSIMTYAWDFDNNGTTDSTARNPTHRYTSVGPKRAVLRVTDSCGATSAAAVRDLTVQGLAVPGNRNPVASFAFAPRTVKVGDPVSFVSSSFDPDGSLQSQTWDLDGDGQFDDGQGAEVVFTYTRAGNRTVRLQVTDTAGVAEVHEQLLHVDPAPKPRPGSLRPSPFIRFSGLVLPGGARVQLLSVRAPKGSLLATVCKGKGCPVKQRRKRAKGRAVRFKSYERFLRAGVQLDIFIRKPNTIGAFTRYKIRAGKGPVRIDRCLPPGPKTKPKRCG
jgi:PKD repeat protein